MLPMGTEGIRRMVSASNDDALVKLVLYDGKVARQITGAHEHDVATAARLEPSALWLPVCGVWFVVACPCS